MRIVLIADRPHGDRVERELRALGHEVAYVQDVHGAAYAAIHPGTDYVVAMNLHSHPPERLQEKARTCGARWVWSQVGWSACKTMLERAGFPFGGQLELAPAPLAPVPSVAPAVAVGAGPSPLFMFEAHAVRVVGTAEEPRFVVADVCAVLEIGNPSDAARPLDPDEKGIDNVDTPSGFQQMLTVTEPGLYALLARSRKPAAKRFDRWVRHEVLPAIRRTGAYAIAPAASSALDLRDPAALRGLLAQLAEVNLEQGKALAAARTELAEAAPKLEAWSHLMDSTGLVPVTLAGKALGVQPIKFFDWMLEAGHLYRHGRHLLARQDHIDAGRMRQTTMPLVVNNEQVQEIRAKLTGAGMAYFAERLELFRAACSPAPRRLAPKANLLARAGVAAALPGAAQ